MLANKFEKQALETPGNIAVKTGSEVFTYHELNRYAGAVARRISEIADGENIALLFDHGAQMIAAVLGVLKAGKTYVPLSVDYPPNRMVYMLTDTAASLIVTNAGNEPLARELSEQTGIPVLDISRVGRDEPGDFPPLETDGDKAAYILYTSGSTGRPKGVIQTHRNVDYFIRHWLRIFSITASDRLTLLSSFCHDASIMDIFSALHSGAALYPVNMKDPGNAVRLSDFLNEEKITVWHSVPTLFSHFGSTLTGAETFPHLRYIVMGGELVRGHEVGLLKRYFPHCTMGNVYGQTETSFNSIYMIRADDDYDAPLLGAPLDETEIFVVDEDGYPVETLEVGEILVACKYVSPGYWKNPEATEKVFRTDEEFGRLYWTGDQGRLSADGNIEFFGRKDHQVKIRGFRIETGEIETQLLKYPEVKEAVVTVHEDDLGDRFLAAYVVVSGAVDVSRLRLFLVRELPDYMIPTWFTVLDKMPRTATNKVDRKALPEPVTEEPAEHYTAPRNEKEEKLAAIWADVLGIPKEKIGIDRDFFQSGGHSLKATLLTTKMQEAFGVRVPLAVAFNAPTIRRLALYMENASVETFVPLAKAPQKEFYPLSSPQRRLYVLQQMDLSGAAYNMPLPLVLEGKTDIPKMEETFRRLISRHESLRTSFHMVDGEPVQKVHDTVDFSIEVAGGSGGVRPSNVDDMIREFIRPFDLTRPPLLRVGLRPIETGKNLLVVDMHHIISDAASHRVLFRDFLSFASGEAPAPLRLHYKDYAEWQALRRKGDEFKLQENYWLDIYNDAPPPATLPTDVPRSEEMGTPGARHHFHITKETAEELKQLALDEGVTLQMLLVAVFHIFLAKLSDREDIVTGTTIAGRRHPDLEEIIGLFANTLALRSMPVGDKIFNDYLREVREMSLGAYENQEYPLEELTARVAVEWPKNRNPLFDIMFEIRSDENPGESAGSSDNAELRISLYNREITTTKFDQDWVGTETADGVFFTVDYSTELFRAETIHLMALRFAALLDHVLENSGEMIKDLDYRSTVEKDLGRVQQVEFSF